MKHHRIPSRVRSHVKQPAGINLAAAFSTSFLLVAVAQVVGLSTYEAVTLIAIVVGLCSTGATWPATLGVAVIGWLFVTGFVINSRGELHITGLPDLSRLLLMLGVAVASRAAGRSGVRTSRRLNVIRLTGPSPSTVVAQPARCDHVEGDGTVAARAAGIHG